MSPWATEIHRAPALDTRPCRMVPGSSGDVPDCWPYLHNSERKGRRSVMRTYMYLFIG
jgi:hypothetical protein